MPHRTDNDVYLSYRDSLADAAHALVAVEQASGTCGTSISNQARLYDLVQAVEDELRGSLHAPARDAALATDKRNASRHVLEHRVVRDHAWVRLHERGELAGRGTRARVPEC